MLELSLVRCCRDFDDFHLQFLFPNNSNRLAIAKNKKHTQHQQHPSAYAFTTTSSSQRVVYLGLRWADNICQGFSCPIAPN
jgi:hypothetical protein